MLLETGLFTSKIELAKVTPIFKRSDRSDLSNYKLILLLPQFKKKSKKIFAKRLSLVFLSDYNI